VTRELRGSKDLWAALQEDLAGRGALRSVLKATAEALRAMHREGVYHSDLNLKNILVRFRPDGVDGYVIDFDKAKLFLGKLPSPLVQKNLDRLRRSALKLDPERRYLSADSWHEFLEFYHGADA
jgi:predicted Ser/Thr protein kinase